MIDILKIWKAQNDGIKEYDNKALFNFETLEYELKKLSAKYAGHQYDDEVLIEHKGLIYLVNTKYSFDEDYQLILDKYPIEPVSHTDQSVDWLSTLHNQKKGWVKDSDGGYSREIKVNQEFNYTMPSRIKVEGYRPEFIKGIPIITI